MTSNLSYTLWREEHKSILERLPDKQVLFFFSGGKDSSLAMDFVLRAAQEFGFDFMAHAGAFPVHRYADGERERIGSYWSRRGVDIIWHEIAETDEEIKDAANPCLPCRDLRRKVLKTILTKYVEDWKSLFLIISYSLWDIVGYSLEHILTDILTHIEKGDGPEKGKRFIETAQRFYPLLKMKEGYTIFRPLIKFNGNDILKLIEDESIPILSIPCKFSAFRPKRIFEKYYEVMGLHFDYKRVFDFAKNALHLPDASSYSSLEKDEYLLNVF